MAPIRVLDKQVAELIAAGEVVERPASVVKELVENSIDAGATAVTVEIQNGGVTYLRITDNGCGIDKEDLPLAFLRHATSKIATSDDLDGIMTLGFRGEALASVAAVARVEVLSCPGEQEFGARYVIEGGEEKAFEQAGCPKGTTVVVRDLFYNTPARQKFLKKDAWEGNAVCTVLERIALSHPEVSFKLVRDGRQALLTPGDHKLSSAIFSVLGKDFARSLLPVNGNENGVKVSGYISKPTAARANRNLQIFFLNGRYIRSATAMAALEEAYKNSIMVGKHPGCVLHLEVDPRLVDVNVHPAKTEVKFADEQPVFRGVYYAVKSALQQEDRPEKLSLQQALQTDDAQGEQQAFKTENADDTVGNQAFTTSRPFFTSEGNTTFISVPTGPVLKKEARPQPPVFEVVSEPPKAIWREMPLEQEISAAKLEDGPDKALPFDQQEQGGEKASLPLTVIGEAFHTYLIAQMGEKLIFVDKHAAHERILYEKIKASHQEEAQMLLTPVQVTLTAEEFGAVASILPKLEDAGFAVEEYGEKTLLVRGFPMALEASDAADIIREIAGKLLEQKQDFTPDFLDWLYHSVACRAAMKAGDKTNPAEMEALLRRILENGDIRYCPHGRPVLVELTKRELEKQFGRIQ